MHGRGSRITRWRQAGQAPRNNVSAHSSFPHFAWERGGCHCWLVQQCFAAIPLRLELAGNRWSQ